MGNPEHVGLVSEFQAGGNWPNINPRVLEVLESAVIHPDSTFGALAWQHTMQHFPWYLQQPHLPRPFNHRARLVPSPSLQVICPSTWQRSMCAIGQPGQNGTPWMDRPTVLSFNRGPRDSGGLTSGSRQVKVVVSGC